MGLQYVTFLYNVFEHQFRDMDTESKAPCAETLRVF